jgi:hypothetical protein
MGLCRVLDLATGALILATAAIAANIDLPSYPLAVKNPYLSTWVPGDQIQHAPTAQPEFWKGEKINWSVLARVNGATYSLFGVPKAIDKITAATMGSISFTSSHTLIDLTAGQVQFTLDFFSPVHVGTDDYARQALPYSYLTVSAKPTGNSASPQIQILSAIDETWTAQNGSSALNYTTSGNAGFFWFFNPHEVHFTENNDMATYGSVLFGTTTGAGVTHACDTPANVYSAFTSQGGLNSTSSCTGSNLVALVKDLGKVGASSTNTSSSVTFAVGLNRDEAINYLGNTYTGYHRSNWPTVPEAMEFFLGDYSTSLTDSNTLDAAVRSKAESVSSTFGSSYADILEASVRQSFGAIELTVSTPNEKTEIRPSDLV